MVVVGVLCMFVFVIGDQLVQVLGVNPQQAGRDQVVFSTKFGDLTNLDLQRVEWERGVAFGFDRFLLGIRTPALEEFEARRQAFMAFIQSGGNPAQFPDFDQLQELGTLSRLTEERFAPLLTMMQQNGLQPSSAPFSITLRNFLMSHWAEAMGVVVTDKAVNQYIKERSGSKATARDVLDFIGRVRSFSENQRRLSNEQFYAVIARQLQAAEAERMLVRVLNDFAPGQRYDFLQRMEKSITARILELPVEPIIAKVPDPSEEQLQSFLDEFAALVPNPLNGEVGFYQPYEQSLEYLRADPIAFAKATVTDAQIQAHYDEKKATEYLYSPPNLEEIRAEAEAAARALNPPAENTDPMSLTPGEAAAEAPMEGEAAPATEDAPAAGDQSSLLPKSLPSLSMLTGGLLLQEDGEAIDDPMTAIAGDTAVSKNEGYVILPIPTGNFELPPDDLQIYRPLTDTLRETIRRQLSEEAFKTASDKVLQRLREQMNAYGQEYGTWMDENSDEFGNLKANAPPPPSNPIDLEAVAETEPWLFFERFTDVSMRDLVPQGGDQIAPELQPLTRIGVEARSGNLESLYEQSRQNYKFRPMMATYFREAGPADMVQEPLVAWKIDESQPHVPELKEVREQVIAAWKEKEAFRRAEQLARELVDLAKTPDEMLSLIQGEGLEKIRAVYPDTFTPGLSEPKSFTWDSPPPSVLQPGDRFMQTVFRMRPGEVGVAINQPQSAVYVVGVTAVDNPQPSQLVNTPPSLTEPQRDALRRRIDDLWATMMELSRVEQLQSFESGS
jgi:hypothetical protein